MTLKILIWHISVFSVLPLLARIAHPWLYIQQLMALIWFKCKGKINQRCEINSSQSTTKITHWNGSKTDLLFQVNNSKKKKNVKKDWCWSRKLGGLELWIDRRRVFPVVPVIGGNSLVAVAPAVHPVAILSRIWSWTVWPPVDSWQQKKTTEKRKQTTLLDNIICFILFIDFLPCCGRGET